MTRSVDWSAVFWFLGAYCGAAAAAIMVLLGIGLLLGVTSPGSKRRH